MNIIFLLFRLLKMDNLFKLIQSCRNLLNIQINLVNFQKYFVIGPHKESVGPKLFQILEQRFSLRFFIP